MTGFGHGECAWNLEVHGTGQKGFVVVFGSQIQNCGAEQAVLNPLLDLQRRISKYQLLEARQRSTGGHLATKLRLEAVLGCATGNQSL